VPRMRISALFAFTLLTGPALAADFRLKVDDLKPNALIPDQYVLNGFGCSGANHSPALSWSGAPQGTKSFAITVYDPDAPTGSGWWQWVVFNIPPSTTSIPEGNGSTTDLPPDAVQGMTDLGKPGYGGPCPPPGKPHRYVFTVHALKTDRLDLDERASGAMVGFNLGQNTIGKASVTLRHGR
jgi:Raf kinase inhibitor-like YbhB/YbcL family protein